MTIPWEDFRKNIFKYNKGDIIMEKAIYKVENLINHKVYIGQTNNPKRRFQEHKNKGYQTRENNLLYRAFDKYGIENFSFEVLEENVSNYNEREKYWIKYYDSHNNGYNMTDGGEEPPVFHNENHPMATHDRDDYEYIKYLLKETNISTKDIAKLTKYNTSSINRINVGELWFDENETYPIRKLQSRIGKRERAELIKNDLINTSLTQKQIADKYKVGRTTVTAINNGQNFHDDNLEYPLRK